MRILIKEDNEEMTILILKGRRSFEEGYERIRKSLCNIGNGKTGYIFSNKVMKKPNYLVFILLILFAAFCAYYFNPNVVEGRKNYVNSKKITRGMTKIQMIDIMGKPDTILLGNVFRFPASYQVYSYSNRFGSSDNLNIVIDTDLKVLDVFSAN